MRTTLAEYQPLAKGKRRKKRKEKIIKGHFLKKVLNIIDIFAKKRKLEVIGVYEKNKEKIKTKQNKMHTKAK